MSVAYDIAKILKDDAEVTSTISDIFISQMPESPDETLTVYETGGSTYDAVSELSNATFSIKSRAAEYERAYEIVSAACACLSAIGDEDDGDSLASSGVVVKDGEDNVKAIYLRVQQAGEPYPMGRDALGRVEFAQSFSAVICR